MEILCHRGLWVNNKEQNKLVAFKKALENGFGVELDVRDMNSDIVISHDPPEGKNALLLEDFFQLYKTYPDSSPWIALNVKADGLNSAIKNVIESYQIENYFTFDMSIPEMLRFKNIGLKYFSRLSEYERDPIMIDYASGIWLDVFETQWYDEDYLNDLLRNKKDICIVSSELHGRDNQSQWLLLKKIPDNSGLMLCTDNPYEAKEYFK